MTGQAFTNQTNTLRRVFFQWLKMHSRRLLLIIALKLQLSLSMYGYLCNGNPSEKTVTEARCYANCLVWVSEEKKCPLLCEILAFVYLQAFSLCLFRNRSVLYQGKKTACKSVSILLVNGELFFNITKRSDVVSIKTKQLQIHILSDFA